jgi:hypothetical protein
MKNEIIKPKVAVNAEKRKVLLKLPTAALKRFLIVLPSHKPDR